MERTGAYLLPRDDLGTAVELAQRAEALGYDSLWVTHGLGRDSFLVLAAYAQATRRIGLGNGVVPIYPRHPVAMAQEAATLAELSGGRFRLGIGVSHRPSMEGMLSLDMKEPLKIMREYVAVLRAALSGRARFDGEYFRDTALGATASPALAVPARLVTALGGIGDRAVVQEFIGAHRQSGVTLPAIRPIGWPSAPWYRATLEAAAS